MYFIRTLTLKIGRTVRIAKGTAKGDNTPEIYEVVHASLLV